MTDNAININERFNDFELFQMFNVELAEADTQELESPLWTNTAREQTADEFTAKKAAANVSDRVARLAAFYAENEEAGVSPFDS